MFSGFTCFDCMGRSMCILFASFWPPQKHTSLLCVCVVEIQTQVFLSDFFLRFWSIAMQSVLLLIETVMNCDRLSMKEISSLVERPLSLSSSHSFCLACSCSALLLAHCVYSYQWVTGALEDVSYVTDQLLSFAFFFFFSFYRLINFIYVFMSNVA